MTNLSKKELLNSGYPDCFTLFADKKTEQIDPPARFTFPFYYDPHPLALIAASELQTRLQTGEFDHNFGLDASKEGLVIGKMFGVLVCRHRNGTIGYLSAFSGKLANSNHHIGFVPPVFDTLREDGFFKEGELVLNELTQKVEQLENSDELLTVRKRLSDAREAAENELNELKQRIREEKQKRKQRRQQEVALLEKTAADELLEMLRLESVREQYFLKDRTNFHREQIDSARRDSDSYHEKLELLLQERRERSAALQQRIFENYAFLNRSKTLKNLLDIFQPTGNTPPAGAGECAAPKLLQYAFMNDLEPMTMAEFWWGASPKSVIRKHQQFYPACRGKCEPILTHMLAGIETDENPMLHNPAAGKTLEIIHADEHLVVVNKPAEFLSVPGKTISDSVLTRLKERFPDADGPMIVHRLDMSTSGIMIVALTDKAYHFLQRQFLKRTVTKRYVALLDGLLENQKGTIELPLRVDLNDRPRQLVCYEHGKYARTEWKVIAHEDGQTRIHFFPVTGRTHQLRVHAAHTDGLNTPITGDDLYGTKKERLFLHAEQICFIHPGSRRKVCFKVPAPF